MNSLRVTLFLNELELICLHTVNGFKYTKWLNYSIWPRDWALRVTITPTLASVTAISILFMQYPLYI